jgi:hypothetical protein
MRSIGTYVLQIDTTHAKNIQINFIMMLKISKEVQFKLALSWTTKPQIDLIIKIAKLNIHTSISIPKSD